MEWINVESLKAWLDVLTHVLFGVVIIATTVVKLTPTKTDDQKLNAIFLKIHKIFSYFPTVGINPKTKEMNEWYEKNKPSGT